MALFGSGLGYIAPVVLGWWVLRRPRGSAAPRELHTGAALNETAPLPLLRESLHSAQAVLAFFAPSPTSTSSWHGTSSATGPPGCTFVGLLVSKIKLYLPQFGVIVMFPSLATAHQQRRAVIRGTSAILALGAVCTPGVVLLAVAAADLLDSEKFAAVYGRPWLFAVLGTLLSITQLLVYATLARQGRRSIRLVWATLAG